MYVACPSCKLLYQIELIHLRAAGGELHCGACKTTFNATAAVFDDPQQALDYAEQHPLQDSVAREIDDLVNRALGQVPGHEHTGAAGGQEPDGIVADSAQITDDGAASPESVRVVAEAGEYGGETDADAEIPEAPPAADAIKATDGLAAESVAVEGFAGEVQRQGLLRSDMDFYACPTAAGFRTQRPQAVSEAMELSAALLYSEESHDTGLHVPWGAIAASVLLAVLLLAQIAWVQRYQLVRLPQLRPALAFFCQPLNCDLPLRHDINRIEVVEREVRDHPHASGALLINASFVNRADFVQTYPVFEISFSDVSGTPVAVRRFPPAEYLIGRQDISDGMAPGERAQLMLEVVDPGDRAVSFQFDFL
ncbi:MAG: zinc-ribbon and DUF3426 domain-containing protein, partial [Thiogranum sp.]